MSFNIILPSLGNGSLEPKRYNVDFLLLQILLLRLSSFFNFSPYYQIHFHYLLEYPTIYIYIYIYILWILRWIMLYIYIYIYVYIYIYIYIYICIYIYIYIYIYTYIKHLNNTTANIFRFYLITCMFAYKLWIKTCKKSASEKLTKVHILLMQMCWVNRHTHTKTYT